MNHITGSFAGKITQQSTLTLTDQPNHVMNIAEVRGTQQSSDPLWDNSEITYWGVTDLLAGKCTQHGYFNNIHPDGGRDFGTFEGKASPTGSGMTVEGTYKFTGRDDIYGGMSGRREIQDDDEIGDRNRVQLGWHLRAGQGASALNKETDQH